MVPTKKQLEKLKKKMDKYYRPWVISGDEETAYRDIIKGWEKIKEAQNAD